MKFPRNIYPASLDPMHFSHKNTLLSAMEYLQEPVTLLICKNNLKDKGLFTLEERREIAKLYVPELEILLAKDELEIKKYFFHANKIIRGIKSQKDINYNKKLLNTYELNAIVNKAIIINIPEEYHKISSSKLKQAVLGGNYGNAKQYALEEVINKIKIKINC